MHRELSLTVVVVVHDIPRERPRTLRAISTDYQRGIAAADYEVLVVDNGSRAPAGPEAWSGLAGDFRVI